MKHEPASKGGIGKETFIAAVLVVGIGAFFLGRITKTEIVTSGAPAAAIGALPEGAVPAPVGDVYRVPVGASPWKGAEHAKVTIVEFSEFQCPFCSRVGPTLQQILNTYAGKVKIVFKHNPLNFHQDAPLAAEASMAAAEQGKFWEYHDKLFANQRQLKRPDLERYAQEVGLDVAKFKQALDSGKFKAAVQADLALGGKLGVDGTPSFFINGRMIAGAMPFDAFKKIIDEELVRADKAIAAGVPITALYDKLTEKGLTQKAAAAPQAARGGDDANAVYKMPLHDSPAKGPATAKVTIVEFSEFQCPFCSRVGPTLQQIMKDYPGQVRIVFKHNPLPFHKDAPAAAEASMAAHDQGKFWEMHDKLFANQKALSRADLERFAQEIGLDMAAFKASLDGNKHKAQIDRDMATAATFGARGTPTFFINGRKLAGAQPIDAFKRIIDEEIKKADAALARGVKAEMLYAELTKSGLEKATAPAPSPSRPADDSKTVYKVPVDRGDSCMGGQNALVTIVEFSEFQCPFCARVLPTMDDLKKTYGDKIRVCFKHNPLPFHKDAVPAANAAIEAGKQGKFWELHDVLFKNQKALSAADLERYAGEVGLDVSAIKNAIASNKHKAVIDAHQKLAGDLGARGTPTFFINGRKLVGAQPAPAFKAIIDEELKKAEALVAKGVKRSRIYEELTKNGLAKAGAAPSGGGAPAADTTVNKVPIAAHNVCKGPKNALVTIAEFSEFQCPFCARVLPTMKEIQDKYGDKVRVCFFHNPLPFHADAPLASQAALAANKQGKFWELHDKMFANQRQLKREDIERYATEVGLDMAQFKSDIDAEEHKAAIKADQDVAGKVGARGTPTFFINGRKLVGAQPAPAFFSIIDEELKKAEAMVRKGVPRSKLYDRIIGN